MTKRGTGLTVIGAGLLLTVVACGGQAVGTDTQDIGTEGTDQHAGGSGTSASSTGIGASQSTSTPCEIHSWPFPQCDGANAVMQFDAAGCPTGYACPTNTTEVSTAPPSWTASGGATLRTTVVANTTCVTNGCSASCALVSGSGGTLSTTTIGDPHCVEDAQSTTEQIVVIESSRCVTRGCMTECFVDLDGSGGSTSNIAIGTTWCGRGGSTGGPGGS